MKNTQSNSIPEIFSDDKIKHHPLFAGLTAKCLNEISGYFKTENVKQGNKITEDNKWILVISGSLDVAESLKGSPGKNKFSLSPGESSGEINLIESENSILEFTAKEDTGILTLSSDSFSTIIRKKNQHTNNFYFNLTKYLCEKLTKLNNIYAELYIEQLLAQDNPQ
ncbi:MAG: cyclic nucleotide-binding domain-containing protein [bacterium]|nr:cyclic nucleotide-binding domain-containing protein [bacterium]